jgi:hypothetical protein
VDLILENTPRWRATIGICTLADCSVIKKCQQALFWRPWRGSQLILTNPSSRYGKTFRIIFWSISRWKTGLAARNFFWLSRAIRGHIYVEAWRSLHWENGFLAKTKIINSSDSNPRAKSRSWGEVKWKGTFGSPTTCVPFLVWLG